MMTVALLLIIQPEKQIPSPVFSSATNPFTPYQKLLGVSKTLLIFIAPQSLLYNTIIEPLCQTFLIISIF
ncbi:MAG: hypothetical protein IJA80_05210 [Clostridia bacterium]|nr:hypothetical protein [Clostridia bacterium]